MQKSIVVVDDDPSVLKGIERILKTHGFFPELFSSVEEFNSRARLEEAICLILDINLNGKSGIELRRQVTNSGILLPAIFITANDSDVIRKAAIDAGCVAYLTKPFPAKALMNAIEKAATESNTAQ
jgi:FixJ family two-component response regulator